MAMLKQYFFLLKMSVNTCENRQNPLHIVVSQTILPVLEPTACVIQQAVCIQLCIAFGHYYEQPTICSIHCCIKVRIKSVHGDSQRLRGQKIITFGRSG